MRTIIKEERDSHEAGAILEFRLDNDQVADWALLRDDQPVTESEHPSALFIVNTTDFEPGDYHAQATYPLQEEMLVLQIFEAMRSTGGGPADRQAAADRAMAQVDDYLGPAGAAPIVDEVRRKIRNAARAGAERTDPAVNVAASALRDHLEAQPAPAALIDSLGRVIDRGSVRTETIERPFRMAAPGVPVVARPGPLHVALGRTEQTPTPDQNLWMLIRNRTNAISFDAYAEFVCSVLNTDSFRTHGFYGSSAYEALKRVTNVFLMHEVGQFGFARLDQNRGTFTEADEQSRLGVPFKEVARLRDDYFEDLRGEGDLSGLPYLNVILDRLREVPIKDGLELARNCGYGILRSRLSGPLAIELIWSYWHEEGMLVQGMNAILARFQNRRLGPAPDPLARLDVDPLRPLSNLLWGWVQDEGDRLTVRRRAYEYDHHYGLRLLGRAVPELRSVDSRSKFLESFHTLLHLAHVFFQQDDDTTVIADGFPVLNALRETHLLLAEGAHNQFGDLPSTARAEMLIMQWLLARPEMREFLGGRIMVPYKEPWMDRLDSIKSSFGWTDTSSTHFRDLGVYGEQILLSVRYGNWNQETDPERAKNWARYWRPEIQAYVHAYRAATGVDLTTRVDPTMPSRLLRARLQHPRGRQPIRA